MRKRVGSLLLIIVGIWYLIVGGCVTYTAQDRLAGGLVLPGAVTGNTVFIMYEEPNGTVYMEEFEELKRLLGRFLMEKGYRSTDEKKEAVIAVRLSPRFYNKRYGEYMIFSDMTLYGGSTQGLEVKAVYSSGRKSCSKVYRAYGSDKASRVAAAIVYDIVGIQRPTQ